MSREKQIEEIANILWNIPNNYSLNSYNDCERIAECIYDDGGYRKQSEGEWIAKIGYAGYGYYCSNCNAVFTGENAEWIAKEHIYCPKCGAKMRGGTE